TESRYGELHNQAQDLEQASNVTGVPQDKFLEAGYNSLKQMQHASDNDLAAVQGLTQEKIADLRAAINFLTEKSAGQDSEG
ncbi:MAG: transcription termination/antitermination protein NusA, partial [Desulfohalobiaceae bacterium]